MPLTIRQYQKGTTITEPGIYAGVPMTVYHNQPCDGPSITSSGLRTIFSDSLAHYWLRSPLNPNREEMEESEPIILGRAAHHLLLGEENFREHYSIRPAEWDSWRTKDAKAWRESERMEGRTALEPKHLDFIKGMAKQLAGNPLVQGGILGGQTELSFFWRDSETGVWLQARPDATPNDSGDFADLKVTSSLDDDFLSRNLADQGYGQQAALVGEGYETLTGTAMTSFALVYVEQKPPNCCRVDEIDPVDIAIGRDANRAALRAFKRALETGQWPGPRNRDGDGGTIRLSQWNRERFQRRIDLMNEEHAA